MSSVHRSFTRILSVEVPSTEVSKFVDFVRSLNEKLTVIEERETSRAEPALALTQTILIGIDIDVTAQVLYDILKYVMTKKYKIRFLEGPWTGLRGMMKDDWRGEDLDQLIEETKKSLFKIGER